MVKNTYNHYAVQVFINEINDTEGKCMNNDFVKIPVSISISGRVVAYS